MIEYGFNSDGDFPFGIPESEEDAPIKENDSEKNRDDYVGTTKLKYKDVINEQERKRAEKRYFSAINLIYVCIGALIFIFIFDYVILGEDVKNFVSDSFERSIL